jgi:hypothetical protein
LHDLKEIAMKRLAANRFLFCGLLIVVSRSATGAEGNLVYRPTSGQVFGYEVTIEADRESYTHVLKGNVIYTVTAAEPKEIKLEYVGNVSPKNVAKPGSRSLRPSPPSPFSSVTAFTRTTNQIGISPAGEVLSVRGDSQLPYLLGNLSLLPLEYLPGDQRGQWTTKIATGVTESGGRRAGPRFLANDEKFTAAGEETSYRITARSASEIAIDKSYQFSSGAQGDNQPRYGISGSGKLVLDARDNLPKSLSFQQTVTYSKENVTGTVPVKIAYHRLSEEEIADVRQQWKENLEAAKARLAEQKEKQSQALSEEDREQILSDLKSTNVAFIMRSLAKLNRRPVAKGDKEIPAALKALLNHKNPGVKRSAADAWAKWSAE